MRQGRRHRRGFALVRFLAVGILCVSGRGGHAQEPAVPPAGNAWATGGVPGGTAVSGTAVPYWQAPALPKAVIQGGAIPSGWVPQAVPYSGIGPDGRPLTMYYAPTYVFTYQVGPPVLAGAAPASAAQFNPAVVNRRQARPPVTQPPQAQGWNYQTQTAPPAPYTLPPATVARYQPAPYSYPPGSPALNGTPIVPPPGLPGPSAMTAAPPTFAASAPPPSPMLPPSAPSPQAFAPAAVPAPPPDQWAASAEPAPPMVAGTAAAIAAATAASGGPSPTAGTATSAFPAPIAPASTPAQPVSAGLTPSAAGRSTGPHLWRVVGVHDGDTVTCLDESNQQQKVRLASIDAPEIGQDYGKVSREVLAEMVFGKTVEVTDEGKDRYGRWIGRLTSGGVDVNRQMVATGNAWHYADYSRDTSLAALQSQAQSQRLGLWAQPDPVAPWDFRKGGQN